MTTPTETVTSPFEQLGGQAVVDRLVTRFYDLMETLPEAAGILALHDDMPRARERLRLFLTGWTGGPPLYENQFGHPRLRGRHLPFAIGEKERDAWLLCMDRALREVAGEGPVTESLMRAFVRLAHHMINQPG